MKTFLLLFLGIPIITSAATFTVGPSDFYTSPNALYKAQVISDGDTIYIKGGDYIGEDALAVWDKDDLFIFGIEGRPHLQADGDYILGKGIWVISGDYLTVHNIEFSGAKVPDHNGAGIRLDGSGLRVLNCHFHHNENGILATSQVAGDIWIEFCEFGYSGYGEGYSHNIYVNNTNRLTFRYNYTHHAQVGHLIKSRAIINIIAYNRIMDEDEGYSSRLIDLPNGGQSFIIGNIMMQGPEAENSNVIGYGLEGLSNDGPHELYVVNNTCVNKRPNSGIFIDVHGETEVTYTANNIYVGDGVFSNDILNYYGSNYNSDDVTTVGFIDEKNYDYRLSSSSPMIDKGVELDTNTIYPLTPLHEYDDLDKKGRYKDGILDRGAYEFAKPSSVDLLDKEKIKFYPNPAHEYIFIGGVDRDSYRDRMALIISIDGKKISRVISGGQLNVEGLVPGIYCVLLESGEIIEGVIVE
jgi:hypothetical protein